MKTKQSKQIDYKKKALEVVSDYYYDNREEIVDNYPGLRIERFCDEFKDFYLGELNFFYNNYPTCSFINSCNIFLEKIKKGVPLEYINNKSYFYSLIL